MLSSPLALGGGGVRAAPPPARAAAGAPSCGVGTRLCGFLCALASAGTLLTVSVLCARAVHDESSFGHMHNQFYHF